MLLIQELLRKDFEAGINHIKNDLHVDIKEKDNRIHFKYNQIDSPMGDPIVQECRGLILDKRDFKVVSLFAKKFFNYHEGHAAKIDFNTAKVFEKVDGTNITLYNYENEWHVQTLGTIDAEGPVNELFGGTFAQLFWTTTDIDLDKLDKKNCYTFELTTKYNRIVTRYRKDEITLLSIRNLETLEEYSQDNKIYNETIQSCTNARRPKIFPFPGNLDAVVIIAKELGMGKDLEEGYVVCDANFNRVKIKNPGYLAVARIKDSSVNSKAGFMQLVLDGEESEFLVHFPEYEKDIFNLKNKFDEKVKEAEEIYDSIKYIDTQKDFALAVQKSKTPFYSFLYGMRVGKYDTLRRAICLNADPRKVLDWIKGEIDARQ